MTISEGDFLSEGSVSVMGPNGPESLSIHDLVTDKKVIIFAVPGAFTPGCSLTHLPGFVVLADKIRAKGIDTIVCLAVNDVFVMDAWGKSQNAEKIVMAADGNATFTQSIGLELDGSGFGMGMRSQRYAMIVDNGKVVYLGVDSKSIEKSSAETILTHLS